MSMCKSNRACGLDRGKDMKKRKKLKSMLGSLKGEPRLRDARRDKFDRDVRGGEKERNK